MGKQWLIGLAFFLCLNSCSAQGISLPDLEKTLVPATSRYEIIPDLPGHRVFKIDKMTGTVFFLTKNKTGSEVWQKIVRSQHIEDIVTLSELVSYQLTVLGHPSKEVYLINIHTGATWILARKPSDLWVWHPLP